MLLDPRSAIEQVDERRAAMLREAEAAWRLRAARPETAAAASTAAASPSVTAARPSFQLRLGMVCIEVRVSHA